MGEKYIGYEELDPGYGFPSMQDSFEDGVYANKDVIMRYLTSGEQVCTCMSYPKDVFSGELIIVADTTMKEGSYMWSSLLAYYVDKYNLRLPKDFEEYILSHSK